MLSYTVTLTVLTSIASAAVISRAKRQYSNYYACGNSNVYSSIGCGAYSGCGTSCAGSTAIILPSTYYAPSSNCQNLCSSINCNQYNGQYINGQYIAIGYGSSQYNPCASSCCYGNNNYNNQPIVGNALVTSGNDWLYSYLTNTNTVYGNGGNIYTPYVNPMTQTGPGPVVISANVQRSPTAFTGIISNGVLLCGGSEPAGGSCAENGQCPSGHFCMAGNVCCRCAVGASSGTCPSGSDSECPVGYACSTTLSCCPSQHTRGSVLSTCANGSCQDGYECGKGNLCYPSYK